jgi:hypothetical protein
VRAQSHRGKVQIGLSRLGCRWQVERFTGNASRKGFCIEKEMIPGADNSRLKWCEMAIYTDSLTLYLFSSK